MQPLPTWIVRSCLLVLALLPGLQASAQTIQAPGTVYLPLLRRDLAWRPFNDASPWNTPIAANPTLDPNSAAMIALWSDPNYQYPKPWINVNWAAPTLWTAAPNSPLYNVVCTLGNCSGFLSNVPIPNEATVETNSDSHMVVMDAQRKTAWDFYRARKVGGLWYADWGAQFDLTGSGVKPWPNSGARASGFPLTAGLITVDEIRQGHLRHALIVVIARAHPCFVSPASTGAGSTGVNDFRYLPFGAHVQLDPTLDLNTLGLTPEAKIIARALQEYGAFVGDQGSDIIGFIAESYYGKPTNPWAGVLNHQDLYPIPANRFRVLNLGPRDCRE